MSILAFNSTTQLQYKTYYQVSVQRLLYEIVCHSLSHSLGVSHSHLVTHSFSRSRLNFFYILAFNFKQQRVPQLEFTLFVFSVCLSFLLPNCLPYFYYICLFVSFFCQQFYHLSIASLFKQYVLVCVVVVICTLSSIYRASNAELLLLNYSSSTNIFLVTRKRKNICFFSINSSFCFSFLKSVADSMVVHSSVFTASN